MENENSHFKNQCIPYLMQQLKESYEDVMKYIDEGDDSFKEMSFLKRQRLQAAATKDRRFAGMDS